MRALWLALLLVAPVLSGCATPPSDIGSSSVPSTTPRDVPAGAPPEGTPEKALFSFNKTFTQATTTYTETHHIASAGWLCVDADLRPTSGSAAIIVVDATGTETTIASTADATLHNATTFANDGPADWTVRVVMQGYSGNVGVAFSQMT